MEGGKLHLTDLSYKTQEVGNDVGGDIKKYPVKSARVPVRLGLGGRKIQGSNRICRS